MVPIARLPILLEMADIHILHAYRHLYRAALQAVRHSSPAKYQIRNTIRVAFRTSSAIDFDSERIRNTEDFLQRARSYTGLEHKILRNLLHVRFWQSQARKERKLQVCHI